MPSRSATRIPLRLVCLVLLLVALLGVATSHAQAVVPTSLAPEGAPSGDPAADAVVGSSSASGLPGPGADAPAEPIPPPVAPDLVPAPAPVVMGPPDVIRESIFGEASEDNWHPLSLGTFFSEGWDDPYVKSPVGTNGAPKQLWFGAADGVFSRLYSVNFFSTYGMTTNKGLLLTPIPWAPAKPNTNGNQYFSTFNLYLPLNQRLELLVVVPFIADNKSGPTGHYIGNFGDLTISERFRLIEQQNFSFQALLTERTPTGQTVNGNDIAFITPGLEFWWNFAPKWVVRGGTGINIDTGRHSATDVYFNTLAMGRYLTTEDARIFKNFVAHVAVSTLSDVLGRKDYITDVYIAPGVRFAMGSDMRWNVLAAVQIPCAGPQPYEWQLQLGLARNY
jgi:hypothetical protein